MAISLVQSGRNYGPWGTSMSVGLTSITAGNLLVAWHSWEGGDDTVLSVSDGTSNFTHGTKRGHSNNDQYIQPFYLLSANSGNKTITVTLDSGKSARTFHVMEFDLQGGEIDIEDGQYGTGSPFSSSAFSTTGSDVICIAHVKTWTDGTFSTYDIAGTTGVGNITVSDGYEAGTWWRNTTVSNDDANVAFSGGSDYVCGVISFKAASGASGNPWYYYAQQMRQKLEEKLKRRIVIPGFADCMRYGFAR